MWLNRKYGVRLQVFLASSFVCAGLGSTAQDTATGGAAVPESQPAAAPAPAAVKPKPPEDAVRIQLNGTRWLLDLTPISASGKVKPQKDTVTFNGQQISSERMTKAGYPTSNYTLTIGDDGVAVWETMQTKESEGVAFWRGEFHGSAMRGVLSRHPTNNAPEDFSFSGREASDRSIVVGTDSSATAQPPTGGSSASYVRLAGSGGGSTQPAPASPAGTSGKPSKKKRGLFGH